MCGRYRFRGDLSELAAHFPDLRLPIIPVPARYNVAPTQPAPVLTVEEGAHFLRTMRWGLVPGWAKDTKDAARCINARCETAADKPSFRSAFQHRRCLVPAHGYYEWTTTPRGKQPWHFSCKNDALMCFAGLWESWTPPEAKSGGPEPVRTFTILTSAPSEFAARWHNRMPVILPSSSWDAWLAAGSSRDDLQRLLVPYDDGGLEAWAVTPRMNSPRFESPKCMVPVSGS